MGEVCFWSVGDGEYAYILQALVHSFHAVGMEGDFHVFSDREIQGAVTHRVNGFDKRGYFFKFHFLQQQVQYWNYRYFIYLDADTLFVRRPPITLIDLLQGDPLHLFLESDCTAPQAARQDWWQCPLSEYVRLMRESGVTSPHIYNNNSGFIVIEKHAVDIVCELALDFANYACLQRYAFPDEPAWAYALHMLSDVPEKHLLSHYRHVWCSDWEGVFKDHLPEGKPWVFHEYMSHIPHKINPAIVHALRSKSHLMQLGKYL